MWTTCYTLSSFILTINVVSLQEVTVNTRIGILLLNNMSLFAFIILETTFTTHLLLLLLYILARNRWCHRLLDVNSRDDNIWTGEMCVKKNPSLFVPLTNCIRRVDTLCLAPVYRWLYYNGQVDNTCCHAEC